MRFTPRAAQIPASDAQQRPAWAPRQDDLRMEGAGHHDRLEKTPVTDPWADSWNSSHLTVSCSKEDLPKSGGAGLFYCFAAD